MDKKMINKIIIQAILLSFYGGIAGLVMILSTLKERDNETKISDLIIPGLMFIGVGIALLVMIYIFDEGFYMMPIVLLGTFTGVIFLTLSLEKDEEKRGWYLLILGRPAVIGLMFYSRVGLI